MPQASPRGGVEVLGEEAGAVSPRQHVLEQLARLLAAAEGVERVDVPERADVEGRVREAEVVGAA